MKKIKFILFYISIALLFGWGCSKDNSIEILKDIQPAHKKIFKEAEQQIKKIKIGMTEAEVKFIIGKPESVTVFIDANKEKEIWIFQHPKVASEPPRCIFDKETNKVIEVFFGENYHLK